jgi:hypothetical protein
MNAFRSNRCLENNDWYLDVFDSTSRMRQWGVPISEGIVSSSDRHISGARYSDSETMP